MENPAPIIPILKNNVDNNAENLTFFSTILPQKAADIPKKNIAKLKAHSIAPKLQHRLLAISALNKDQQYTVPIEQCKSNAGIAPQIHLLFMKDILLITYNFCILTQFLVILVLFLYLLSCQFQNPCQQYLNYKNFYPHIHFHDETLFLNSQ